MRNRSASLEGHRKYSDLPCYARWHLQSLGVVPDNVLSNVGRVVGDPLQLPGDREQIEARLDVRWFLAHVLDDLGNDVAIVPIDLVIEPAHRA